MRKMLLILSTWTQVVAWTLLAASCSKSNKPEPPDNGCIQRIAYKLSDPAISPAQIHTADSLLDAINVDHDNYRYLLFSLDTALHQFNQFIVADQYVNGLRIINGPMMYLFQMDTLNYSSGFQIHNTTLDTVPSLSLSKLRLLFSADLRKHGWPSFTDSCYKAEFGYINLGAPTPVNLSKAWRVSIDHINPAENNPYDYPRAIYQDSDGSLWGFQGGYVTF